MLKVNPKQIHGSAAPLGNVPTKVYEHVGNHKTKGKNKKQPKGEFFKSFLFCIFKFLFSFS